LARRSLIQKQPFRDKIAVVCGGSKGIGKETAREIVTLGGSVCLIARDAPTLAAAADEIRPAAVGGGQFVETIACDTTDQARLEPLLTDFVARRGVPDYLINAVGYAHPGCLPDLTLDDFRRNMDVNYYGQLVPTLILLPHFTQARKGHIANVSSMAGYLGVMGYATYTPTKYAIVGLSEVLRHELKPYGITLSVLYPPDTDTPGFATENLIKPPECAMMSANAGLLKPEQVAEAFVAGIVRKRFHILPGEAGMVWRVARFFPWLLRWFLDNDYRKARHKLGKDL
jgi:3-dehydrosphinganine reductase